jgi:hypothetical protein
VTPENGYKGGFVVGTIGMEGPLGQFAQALRALPAVKFTDVPGLFDPVAVRQQHEGAWTYFYVVNRLSCPVELHLTLAGQIEGLTDLSTGQCPSPLPVSRALIADSKRCHSRACWNAMVASGFLTRGRMWARHWHEGMFNDLRPFFLILRRMEAAVEEGPTDSRFDFSIDFHSARCSRG